VLIALFACLAANCGDDDDDDDLATGFQYECNQTQPVVPTDNFFEDISDASGIRVDNFYPEPPAGTVINDHSRLAFADINGDGFDDAVMHSLFPNPQSGVPFEHLISLNNGDGTFTDFSDDSGLRNVQAGFFAFADIDNDGDQDLFSGLDIPDLSPHTSAIYLNNGDGVFAQLDDSGVEGTSAGAGNAVFGDFNNDGVLDLFVGIGHTSYYGRDELYFGNGDGTFEDVSNNLKNSPSQPSNGCVTSDYDNDGDLDIFVSTYGVSVSNGLNHLWENDGTGNFTQVAVERGFASLATGNYHLSSTGYGLDSEPGKEPGEYVGSNGFGIDCGDLDNDGDIDVFLTAISHPSSADNSRKWSDPSQVLINGGSEAGWYYENQWLARSLPFNEGDVDGAMIDFDNDGRFDLSLSRDRKYEGSYDEIDQKAWFGLMRQLEDGSFESLGYVSGINDPDQEMYRMKSAQNHAWSDIDHDGDLDLLVGGRDQGGGRPNFLFRNDIGHQNRWLAVRLEGDGNYVNRDAIGTRVTLSAGSELVMRENKSSRGMYNSEDTQVLHFGLGDLPCNYQLIVRWPDGEAANFDRGDFGDNMFIKISYPDSLEIL